MHPVSWQQAVESLPRRTWDVVVVGAGPAGSTAASHLAARGHRVLLLERHRFPRDKACGDGLIPDTLACLKRLGIQERVREQAFAARGATVFSPSRIRFEVPGELLVIRRKTFDALLAGHAADSGATVAQGQVTGIEVDGEGIAHLRVARSDAEIRARYAVVATGADVSLLHPLGMVERAAPSGFALRCYVRSPVRIDTLVISLDRSILPGYAWIFPLPDGEYNVGCGVFDLDGGTPRTDLRATFDTFVREFPLARRLLDRATEVTPPRGARLRCGLHGSLSRGPANVFAAGESIGTTFPFTGEGIGKAMESAEIAAAAIDDALRSGVPDPLNRYPHRLEQELRPRYRGYRVAERWLSRAWVADVLAWRASRSAHLRELAAGIVNETSDPERIFSARGVLSSFWR